MTDLSGQVVHIVLNPAQSGTTYDPTTKILTFTDMAGNVQRISVPGPNSQMTSGWWTCFPQKCDT